MKSKFYVIITLMTVIAFNQLALANNDPQQPVDATPGWYQEAVKNIQRTTYRFQAHGSKGLFRAINHKQHLSFHIDPLGYSVQIIPNAGKQKEWQVSFALKGIGRNGKYTGAGNDFSIKEHEEKLSYGYASISIEYINDERAQKNRQQRYWLHPTRPPAEK